jgi:hypothetical protein
MLLQESLCDEAHLVNLAGEALVLEVSRPVA